MTRPVVEYITSWLVDSPEAVVIEELEGERGELILEVSVHPEDMGKIIGKRGRIIRAVRSIAKAAGQKQGEQVAVEVVD